MITLLSLILFLLLVSINKTRGIKMFVTFFLNVILIIMYIILIGLGFNPIITALVNSVIATIISLFILNGYNLKTKASFISIMIVISLIFLPVYLLTKESNIQGFSIESLETIGMYSFDINTDMSDVMIGMLLLSIIGTIVDTSMSISSAMNEIFENNKKISQNSLFKSGINIGHDILSTTINTLFFPFVSTFIGFFIWHRNQSIEFLINYKVFAQFMFQLLISFIVSILIIPITAIITSRILKKE